MEPCLLLAGLPTLWRTPRVLRSGLLKDSALLLLAMYPEALASYSTMFFAAVVTGAGKWRQPRCSSADEWSERVTHSGILVS